MLPAAQHVPFCLASLALPQPRCSFEQLVSRQMYHGLSICSDMAAQPVNPRDAALSPPDASEIRVHISNEIQRQDAGARTTDQLRRQVALNLGLDAVGLDGRKDEFLELTSSVTEDMCHLRMSSCSFA